MYADAGSISEVDLAVPLIILPAWDLALPTGRRIEGLASLVDVAPTALDLARLPIPEGLQGHSMRALWEGNGPIREHAFALGSVHEGFGVVDSRGLFAQLWPARSTYAGLGETWYGSGGDNQPPVEFLHAKREGLRPFAYRLGIPDKVWASELRTRGQEWKTWGETLAGRLHGLTPKPTATPQATGEGPALSPWGVPVWVE